LVVVCHVVVVGVGSFAILLSAEEGDRLAGDSCLLRCCGTTVYVDLMARHNCNYHIYPFILYGITTSFSLATIRSSIKKINILTVSQCSLLPVDMPRHQFRRLICLRRDMNVHYYNYCIRLFL